MRSWLLLGALALLVFVAPAMTNADERHGTADEAKAMVEKAVALLKDVGPEKAFAAFDPANKDFHDRDLYIFVRSMDGNTVAHGVNKGMIGHTSLEQQTNISGAKPVTIALTASSCTGLR